VRGATYSLVLLATLPLLVEMDALPVDEKAIAPDEVIRCEESRGKLVVAVTDHRGQPLTNTSVHVSDVPVPEEMAYNAWAYSHDRGSAKTGADGCAYITLENAEAGKRNYYIWVLPREYRATKKTMTLDSRTPEAAGVVRVRVKNKPNRGSGACYLGNGGP
jgi:hypothetical protein